MQPGILSIKVEDKSDMFHKFSLLKDEDISYELPSQVGLSNDQIQGVRYVDEREYRERKS